MAPSTSKKSKATKSKGGGLEEGASRALMRQVGLCLIPISLPRRFLLFFSTLSVLSYQLLFLSNRPVNAPVNFSVIICVLVCAYAITRLISSPEDSVQFTESVFKTTKSVGGNLIQQCHAFSSLAYNMYMNNDSKEEL